MPESDGSANALTDRSPAPEGTSDAIATSDVFVSYASQDAAIANGVLAALERQGLKCWIAPRDVTPGALYADEIIRAINSTKVLVLVLSKSAIASPHIGKEVERASSKQRRIVTVKTDASQLTTALEYFLSESQWIDLGNDGTEAAFAKLVRAVRHQLAPVPPIPPVSAPDRAPLDHPQSAVRRYWPLGATLAVVGLVLARFAIDTFRSSRHIEAPIYTAALRPDTPAAPLASPAAFTPPPHSIAVLPFVNMSGDPKQEYFSDGVSEELLNALANMKGLQVVGRTSSFSFKGQDVDLSTIAHKLNVGAVLEGSVRRAGNTVRITVQLIDAVSGFHLWSQIYDRNLGDILKVQTDVAGSVAQQLKISLVTDEVKKIEAHETSSDAYAFYLQGRQALRQSNTKTEDDNAAALFRQSVAADPGFAEGWLYLEGALSDEVIDGLAKPEVVSAEMRHAADEVVALEPGSATAHRAVAQIYWSLDWNWLAATAEYKHAYEMTPGNSAVVTQLADVTHAILGDETTALSLYRRAIDLDPLNASIYLQIGRYYLGIGKLPEAESAFRQSLVLNPKGPASVSLCQALVARGEAIEALAVVQRVPDDSDRRWGAALVYQALGRKAEADATLADAERLDAEDNAYSIAEIHAYRSEIDQAFAWLDRAYRQRDFSLSMLKSDPLLNTLRGDSRYKTFLRKMHLPA